MKKKFYYALLALFVGITILAQDRQGYVGIGTDDPLAKLDVTTTTSGFLPPRLTTAQRDLLTLIEGLVIYNTDMHCLQYWNATEWFGYGCLGNQPTITDCTSGALNGTYQAGTPMNSSNTVSITVNAPQAGSWTASSNTVNGVTWSGSGTFTSAGSQTITLTASGTPVAEGTFAFTFTIGSSTCTRSITFGSAQPPVTITDCTSGTLNGTYQAGTAMNSSNTVSVTVNVNQTGPWTASSNTVNGVTWSGSGTFTSTGSQTITLTASGTPTASGTFSYTFTIGSSTCTRSITFGSSTPPTPSFTSCNEYYVANEFPVTTTIDGKIVHITVSGTVAGTTASTQTCNTALISGVQYFGLGKTGATSTTFNFDRPVSNVQFLISQMNSGENITFTANNGGTVVTPTLTLFQPYSGAGCIGCFSPAANVLQTVCGGVNAAYLNVGGVYFTSLTVEHPGTANGAVTAVAFCNGASQ